MRWESIVLGVIVLAFGVFLVSSHGYIGSTYLPGLIGLPAQNTTSGASPLAMFGGYGPGTIVSLAGLGMIGNGLRAPASRATVPGGSISPEMMAAFLAAQQQMPRGGTSVAPGMTAPSPASKGCPACGAPNSNEAVYCQKCAARLSGPAAPSSKATVTPSK